MISPPIEVAMSCIYIYIYMYILLELLSIIKYLDNRLWSFGGLIDGLIALVKMYSSSRSHHLL